MVTILIANVDNAIVQYGDLHYEGLFDASASLRLFSTAIFQRGRQIHLFYLIYIHQLLHESWFLVLFTAFLQYFTCLSVNICRRRLLPTLSHIFALQSSFVILLYRSCLRDQTIEACPFQSLSFMKNSSS